MINIQIRPANLNDLQSLNRLMYDLHDFHHRSCPKEIKTAQEIAKEKSITKYLNTPECLVYVATHNDQIVGFITGHFCELVSEISKPLQMGSIDELMVLPEYRHRTIAQQLVQKIEHTFEEYGVKKIFVEVWEFNKEATHFYHKNGFVNQIYCLCKSLVS